MDSCNRDMDEANEYPSDMKIIYQGQFFTQDTTRRSYKQCQLIAEEPEILH